MKPILTLADFKAAATRLRIDMATIRAVTQVESGGHGFDASGRCIIRFEPHVFSRKTKGVYDQSHPELSFPVRKPGYPTGVAQSWMLFQTAAGLNANAAVQSTSWGLFQIMGENYALCDCENLGDFVKRMESSEADQLDLFVSFIQNTGLDDELRHGDWASFARQYNGHDYATNKYDTRLKLAHLKFSSAG